MRRRQGLGGIADWHGPVLFPRLWTVHERLADPSVDSIVDVAPEVCQSICAGACRRDVALTDFCTKVGAAACAWHECRQTRDEPRALLTPARAWSIGVGAGGGVQRPPESWPKNLRQRRRVCEATFFESRSSRSGRRDVHRAIEAFESRLGFGATFRTRGLEGRRPRQEGPQDGMLGHGKFLQLRRVSLRP